MISTSFDIVTKADDRFFPGLRALLGSLIGLPSRPAAVASVVVIDAGLSPENRGRIMRFAEAKAMNVRLLTTTLDGYNIRPEEACKYSRANFAILEYDPAIIGSASDVFVHLDADTVVTGRLDPLVEAARFGGFAAVPDHPPLDIAFQVGDADLLTAIIKRNPVIQGGLTAFNAGVFAVTQRVWSSVRRAIASFREAQELLYTNDQAILNLAVAASDLRFLDVGRRFNARPYYRRDRDLGPPELILDGPRTRVVCPKFGDVSVVHFCGPLKPWDFTSGKPSPYVPGFSIWSHFNDKFCAIS